VFYQLKSYLKFLFRSSNEHGVHSPFVYNYITKCFYDSAKHIEFSILKKYRKQLLSSSEHIEITDFGEGSRVFTSNTRKIAAIAKNAGITAKKQKLLFKTARYFKAENFLELGTSLGLATAALSLANPLAKIQTVEGCPNTAKVANQFFENYKLENIQLHTMRFEDYLAKLTSEKFDLVYIDGNHNREKTLHYFNLLKKHATNDSVFIFDDIYWSEQMTLAWKEILEHPKVTLSIDTFHWGLIFFRREQAKEHFVIRL
jgi:predicted O-methyltransferase YrrM